MNFAVFTVIMTYSHLRIMHVCWLDLFDVIDRCAFDNKGYQVNNANGNRYRRIR